VGDADEPFERPDGRFRGAMAALVDERGDDGAHIARALRLVLAHLRDCSPGDSDGLDAIRARLAEKRLEALSGDGAEILNPVYGLVLPGCCEQPGPFQPDGDPWHRHTEAAMLPRRAC
jgi:hypothetical protein